MNAEKFWFFNPTAAEKLENPASEGNRKPMAVVLMLAAGWVPSPYHYRWSLPSDPLSDVGLGPLRNYGSSAHVMPLRNYNRSHRASSWRRAGGAERAADAAAAGGARGGVSEVSEILLVGLHSSLGYISSL